MQSVSSKIWTCVAVFISYDDNNNSTGTSTVFMYTINSKIITMRQYIYLTYKVIFLFMFRHQIQKLGIPILHISYTFTE